MKKQTLRTKAKTLVSTAKYFDLIITFCFSLYDSWMLSDKYTLKQVTFNLELKTFFSQNMTKFHGYMENFLLDCHSLAGSFPRWMNLVWFPFNCLLRIFFPIASLKLKKIECILKKTSFDNWNYAVFISVCADFRVKVFIVLKYIPSWSAQNWCFM